MSNVSQKAALTLSAVTLIAVGSLIVFAPAFLFGLNQVVLDPSAAMMSEIRSPGVLLLFGGAIALAGLILPSFERPALVTSTGLLLSYGFGRLISLPLDGLPPASLQIAAFVELGLGSWCAIHIAGHGQGQAKS